MRDSAILLLLLLAEDSALGVFTSRSSRFNLSILLEREDRFFCVSELAQGSLDGIPIRIAANHFIYERIAKRFVASNLSSLVLMRTKSLSCAKRTRPSSLRQAWFAPSGLVR